MAVGDVANVPGLAAAFAAASGTGFQLFFSFDYAGNGPWPKQTVIDYINQYSGNGAYFHYNGQPFVSTFEGPGNADDWTDIKAQTGCFFMPDWSSRGAKAALELNNGVADGLFSWAGWYLTWQVRSLATVANSLQAGPGVTMLWTPMSMQAIFSILKASRI